MKLTPAIQGGRGGGGAEALWRQRVRDGCDRHESKLPRSGWGRRARPLNATKIAAGNGGPADRCRPGRGHLKEAATMRRTLVALCIRRIVPAAAVAAALAAGLPCAAEARMGGGGGADWAASTAAASAWAAGRLPRRRRLRPGRASTAAASAWAAWAASMAAASAADSPGRRLSSCRVERWAWSAPAQRGAIGVFGSAQRRGIGVFSAAQRDALGFRNGGVVAFRGPRVPARRRLRLQPRPRVPAWRRFRLQPRPHVPARLRRRPQLPLFRLRLGLRRRLRPRHGGHPAPPRDLRSAARRRDGPALRRLCGAASGPVRRGRGRGLAVGWRGLAPRSDAAAICRGLAPGRRWTLARGGGRVGPVAPSPDRPSTGVGHEPTARP
jgi:hypothetical protein